MEWQQWQARVHVCPRRVVYYCIPYRIILAFQFSFSYVTICEYFRRFGIPTLMLFIPIYAACFL